MSRRRRDNESARKAEEGFTLLEVLVAFVLLGFALNALYGQFFTGLLAARTGDAAAAATRLAQSKLEAAGISEPLSPGETAGRFANGFQWRRAVAPYRGALALPRYEAVAPYEVAVTVTWPDARSGKSVTLSAIRLVAQPGGERR